MTAFLALLRKDLQLYFANRRAVLMSIVAPIVIAAFFGGVFNQSDNGPAHIPVVLTDLDHSPLSTGLAADLRRDPALSLELRSAPEAAADVQAGRARAGITLPAGFGAAAREALLHGGAKPAVDLRYDPSQSMLLPMLRGLLAQHTMAALIRSLDPDTGSKDPAASGPAELPLPFAVRAAEIGTRPDRVYNSYAHSFAGMGVQFILLLGVDMGIGLLTLRRMGLWQRLRAAPLSRRTLLGSRIASGALIALFVFAVIYTVAMLGFGVRVDGSRVGFVAVLLAFSALTASFGMLIAAIGRTPEATRGLAILATLLMVMLGGAWVPAFIFPAWLQKLSLGVPTRWAVDGLDAMTWRAQPWDAAVAPVAVMLAFSAAFTLLAVARFRWEE